LFCEHSGPNKKQSIDRPFLVRLFLVGILVQPILKFAGQDISHWFDRKTRDPKTWVDPDLNVRMPFTPFGRYVHIPPREPVTTWETDFGTPWWRSEKYLIGNLSKKRRRIRIVNQLTGQDDVLNVCSEVCAAVFVFSLPGSAFLLLSSM
jgi:hypothetical protein